ncbi:unnamed protein product [Rotaria sp. Silwood2]|nr:unnamed protein product [Rotaria sp. Silwood2]CAF4205560.1 unnamed protein product [Rotaria sp. Silwood2]
MDQLEKYHVEIGALTECGMSHSGISYVGNYTVIHFGASGTNKTLKAHGVAICLNKHATKIWKISGSIWIAINSRVVTVHLRCNAINITIIAIYAPVNRINDQKEEEESSDAFYDDLQQVVQRTRRKSTSKCRWCYWYRSSLATCQDQITSKKSKTTSATETIIVWNGKVSGQEPG